MRAFIASCIFFATLVGGVIFCGVSLSRGVEEMEEMTEQLATLPPEQRGEEAEAVSREWERRRTFYSLVVHRSEFERVEETLIEVVERAKQKDDSEFEIAVAILMDAWRELGTAVGFSLESIF